MYRSVSIMLLCVMMLSVPVWAADIVSYYSPTGNVIFNLTGGTASLNSNEFCFADGTGCPSTSGDITAVTAGSGLLGGGVTGDVTLNVSADTCITGNYSTYNGSHFTCSPDQSGGGGGTPGGSDTQIQFNDGGSFGGNANFTFNQSRGQIIVPVGSATFPSISPADSASNADGIYWTSFGNELDIGINGARTMYFQTGGLYANGGNGPLIANSDGTANPTLVPVKIDSNTGVGGTGADGVSLRAGGSVILLASDDVGDEAVLITPVAATDIGLTVQGAAAQSANLQEWQNSGGGALSRITSTGLIQAPNGAVGGAGIGFLNDPDVGMIYNGAQELVLISTGRYLAQFGDSLSAYIGPLNVWDDGSSHQVVFRGGASQAVNITEWQDSSGTVLYAVQDNGNVTMKSPDNSYWNCGVDNSGTFSCS